MHLRASALRKARSLPLAIGIYQLIQNLGHREGMEWWRGTL